MDDPLDPVGVVVLDHDQAGVAGGDAAPQRRLDRLGGVDRDHRRDRRHHLARLLLVQVEDAAEHPRLAGVERAAQPRAVDDLLQVLGGVVLFDVGRVDAEEADDRVRDRAQAHGHRGRDATRNQLSGRETRRAVRSALAIASIFGTCSPMLMWIAVTRAKAIASESADGGPVREAAEDRLEQLRQRGLAEEADADRGHRDPDLAGGERLVDLVELLDDGLGAALAFLGELFDLAAAAAHQRELGRDEEAVDRDQQQQQDEQQDAHRLFGPVLRGRSSSAIRRTEYSFAPAGTRASAILGAMRIASLVPSATEMLFALGLGDSVVAVTHECDYPPEARSTPPPDAHRPARRASPPARSTPR